MTSAFPLVSALSVVGTPPEVKFLDSLPSRKYLAVTVFPSSNVSTISMEFLFWMTFNRIFGSFLAAFSPFNEVSANVPEKSRVSCAMDVALIRNRQQIAKPIVFISALDASYRSYHNSQVLLTCPISLSTHMDD